MFYISEPKIKVEKLEKTLKSGQADKGKMFAPKNLQVGNMCQVEPAILYVDRNVVIIIKN